MKKIILIIVFLLLVACVNGNESRGTEVILNKNSRTIQRSPFGNYYAILIYVDDYTYLSKLETPKYDVEAIANILTSRYGFKDTKIVPNPKNRDELVAVLDTYVNKMTREDNLLIYYAGHGSFEERMNEGFWQLKDAKNDSRVGWISIKSAIKDTISMTNAKHVLVISDSCYAGAILRDAETNLPINRDMIYYKEIHEKKSRKALTSGGLESVLDSDPISPDHSIFVNALLNTLEQNTKSLFSLEEKFPEIKRYVKGKTTQTPQYANIQTSIKNEGGDFIFLDNFSSIPIPPPIPTSIPSERAINYVKLGNNYRKNGDIEKARNAYLQACDLKIGAGCAGVGLLDDRDHNRNSAINFLTKACEYGHEVSCNQIQK